ncbi:MAG: MBL fold metallo-hydrolase [Bacteroidota bacterium]
MKITFLGTGTSQGVPIIACNCEVCRSIDPRDQRLRSSVLVETDNLTIIIDTGPDFRHQMLRENVQDLDAVLYTHGHRDHIAGLDDIRAFNFIKQKPMDVYAEKRVIRALQKEFSYIFAEKKYPGVPQVNIHTIDTETFSINGENIIPVRGMHYRLPVLGFRIGDFTYLTDVNYISEEEKEKIFGSKYIVLTGLRKQKHISHFTLDEAIHLIRELSPRRGYITHISHQLGLYKDIAPGLPSNVELAYDGLVIEV